MTEKKTTVQIGWPQVASLAVMIAGVIALLVFTPTETLDKILDKLPWESIAALAVASIAALVSTILGPLLKRPAPEAAPGDDR